LPKFRPCQYSNRQRATRLTQTWAMAPTDMQMLTRLMFIYLLPCLIPPLQRIQKMMTTTQFKLVGMSPKCGHLIHVKHGQRQKALELFQQIYNTMIFSGILLISNFSDSAFHWVSPGHSPIPSL
jgi:hypothetical protein